MFILVGMYHVVMFYDFEEINLLGEEGENYYLLSWGGGVLGFTKTLKSVAMHLSNLHFN